MSSNERALSFSERCSWDLVVLPWPAGLISICKLQSKRSLLISSPGGLLGKPAETPGRQELFVHVTPETTKWHFKQMGHNVLIVEFKRCSSVEFYWFNNLFPIFGTSYLMDNLQLCPKFSMTIPETHDQNQVSLTLRIHTKVTTCQTSFCSYTFSYNTQGLQPPSACSPHVFSFY